MVDIVRNIISPILQLTLMGGVGLFLFVIVYRAVSKQWKQKFKWIWKYSIMRKKYDDKTIKWVLDAIDSGRDYWELKKILLIKNIEENRINEVMWIYLKTLKQLKGGNEHGQRIARSYKQTQNAEFPSFP